MSTEAIRDLHRPFPSLDAVSTAKSGPVIRRIRARSIVIWTLLCLAGTTPWALARMGIAAIPAWIQTAGLGLWFPGAGLIAVGSVWCIVLGLAFYLVTLKLGNSIWGMPALVLIVLYLWGISIAGAALIPAAEPPWYTLLIIVVLVTWTVITRGAAANRTHTAYLARRAAHLDYLPTALPELEARLVECRPPERRELTPDQLAASRYLYELTLRKPGDFTGYESVEQILSSALRYTLDYLGYSLALLQCHYTPSFRGYLGRAQRFVIESFTLPEVCGYWKWEHLSSLRWSPDPIKHLNVMFTGWSGLVITLYGANTGDLRYEEPGALKFRPFARGSRTYDYNTQGIVDAIVRNWREYPTHLYPCEPHLTFPQCNTFAMDAVLAWDRHHGTRLLEGIHPLLDRVLQENFIQPSGDIAFLHNTLLGFRSLDEYPPAVDGSNAFIMARILNAVYPGLARRTYLFALKDYVDATDGGFRFAGDPPERQLDGGNFKAGPAYNLGIVAAAACEIGDRPTVDAMLAAADRFLPRLETPGVLGHKKASVIGNAHLAGSRFAEKDDFSTMIHRGPGAHALEGPVLADCAYPAVLVARAATSGDDLDLVLYNGGPAGPQPLELERLGPGRAYRVRGGADFTADARGKAVVDVILDGRTPVHIVPA